MNTQVLNITEKEYRSLPHLNASKFKAFYKSPMHFKHQEQPEESEEMRIGTAVHTLLLEPNNFHNTVAYAPLGLDRRKTEDKIRYNDFIEASAGKMVLKGESRAIVEGCVNAISNHPTAVQIMSKCDNEQVIVADLVEGVTCKGKLDLICVQSGILADIKTTGKSADHTSFSYAMQDSLYWLQAGFYALLAEAHYQKEFKFSFIVVEKEAPYGVAVHAMAPELLKQCKDKVRLLLTEYSHCKTHDAWRGLNDSVISTLRI
jgi:exodeoxyribonuclease VIII